MAAAGGKEAQRISKVRATVLLPGERRRKELMTRVAVRDEALIDWIPARRSVKSTAQAYNVNVRGHPAVFSHT